MTNDLYFTFQKFSDKAAALELTDILKSHNINSVLEDASPSFDPSFSNNELIKEYRVKLLQKDFEQARQLLLQLSSRELEHIDQNHYLYDFSDEELMDLISKQDEWSALDFLLAQKILKERGHEMPPEIIETIRRERLKELAAPEKNQTGWIIAGYFFALLGGLLGVFIGWYLHYQKKTLPNGSSVYAYSSADRRHGFNILILGIVSCICWILFR